MNSKVIIVQRCEESSEIELISRKKSGNKHSKKEILQALLVGLVWFCPLKIAIVKALTITGKEESDYRGATGVELH